MQISITTIMAFLAATTLAAPAADANAEADANELLPRQSSNYVRFYNNFNYDKPLGNVYITAENKNTCVKLSDPYRSSASSVRVEGALNSCTFYRNDNCQGAQEHSSGGNINRFRPLVNDHCHSLLCNYP